LYYLAAAGVGRISIVDPDQVAITNLNRQFLHFEEDIGRSKVQSAAEKLSRFNSGAVFHTIGASVDRQNAESLIAGHDIVLSCVDNYETRILLNRACIRSGIPLVDGGVNSLSGYALTVLPGSPCYECIFPGKPAIRSESGVLGATAGVVGSIMAAQAVKFLAGIREGSGFLLIDLLTLSFQAIRTNIRADCPSCHSFSDPA
jgi:adenylyltransferase/sulfurtransferase